MVVIALISIAAAPWLRQLSREQALAVGLRFAVFFATIIGTVLAAALARRRAEAKAAVSKAAKEDDKRHDASLTALTKNLHVTAGD